MTDHLSDVRSPELDRWQHAVDAGASGRYAAARAAARTLRHAAHPTVRSFAWSLDASLLRQLGRHDDAAVADGAALAVVGVGPHRCAWSVDASTDALVGLAADSIGSMRLGRARALLDRARVVQSRGGDAEGWGRSALRVSWVCAEVEMASGDGRAALRYATAAVEEAASSPSGRHRYKSSLILAAAHLVSGRRESAAELSSSVLQDCEDAGLLPLAWAAAAVADAAGAPGAARRRDAAEVAIRQRGGIFRR